MNTLNTLSKTYPVFLEVPVILQRLFIAFLLLLAQTLGAGEPGQGNGSIEPTRRWIPAGPAHVDAVTGRMELNLPIGPSLPGRVPIGFVWHSEGTNGSFDSYQWPAWDTTQVSNRVTVTLGHERVTFLRGAPPDVSANPQKWLQDRGLSSGQEKVTGLDAGYTSYFGASIFTSEDGSRHLIAGAWYVKAPLPPKPWGPDTVWPPADPRVFAPRMAVVQGDNVIWASFEDATGANVQQTAHSSTEIKNRWGDWVRLDKTLDPPTGAMVGGTLTSSLGHSLTLGGSGSAWYIDNSMGLPRVEMTSNGEIFQGFLFTSVARSGLSGNDWTLGWSNAHLASIESRTGSKVEYQWVATNVPQGDGVPTPAGEAFGTDGNWKGFEPVSYTAGQLSGRLEIGELQAAVKSVKFTSTTPGETGGSLVEFIRTFPKPTSYDTNNKTIIWTSTSYQTEIRYHPQPDPGTSYRFTRLTHVQPINVFGATDQALSDQRQMALFALSTVVQELQGTVSGSLEVIRKKVTHDGWTLKGPMNVNGDVTGLVALNPVPTRSTVQLVLGEGPTQTSERLNWTGRVFGTQRQIITPGSLTAYDGTGKPANAVWRGGELPENDQTMGGIERTGTVTASWNSDLILLLNQSSSATVGGSNHTAYRGVASADLGTKSYQNDSLGRVTLITGVTGAYTSTLEQTPEPGRPEVKSTLRKVTGPNGSSVPLSGQVGEEFAYTGLWRIGVRQLPDPRWATEERDSLGRPTATVTPDGIRTTVYYDTFGRAWKTVREARGAVPSVATWKEWDLAGRWVREHGQGNDGSDVIKEIRLDAFGRTVAVTTAKGTTAERTVYFEYDGYGQKTRESLPTKPGGTPRYSETVYDLDGSILQTKNTRGVVTASFNRPVAGTLDGQTGYLFTSNILRQIGTIETNTIQKVLKDDLGQVIRSMDVLSQITRMAYDAFGRLKEVRRGDQIRTYTQNEMGWLLNQTQPEEGTTIFEQHTVTGQALKFTKGSGAATTTILTDLYPAGDPKAGLVWTVSASGMGSATTSTLAYDTQRRLHSRIDTQANGTVTETYDYDDLSRLKQKTTSDGTVSFTVSRDFDAFGNVTRLNYPGLNGQSGRSVTRAYDTFHRPKSVAFGPTGAEASVASMAYDQVINGEAGERLSYANAATTTWQRNIDQELSRVIHGAGGATIEDASVAWSNDGRMFIRGADIFEYDGLGRLAKATVYGVNGERTQQTYGYDLYGNRTSVGSTALIGSLHAEAVSYWLTIGTDNRLPSTTNAGVSTGAQYDGLGRLSQVWAIPGDTTTLTTWNYDALGRVVAQGGALVYAEAYLLDGAGLRFKRVKQDGTIQYRVYGFDREPLSTFEKPSASQMTGATTSPARSASSSAMASAQYQGMSPMLINPGDDPLPSSGAAILQPSGPLTVGAGQTVAFVGDGNGTSFAWTFGDGATAVGPNPSHSYGSPGSYQVFLTVKGTGYSPSSASVQITVVLGPSISSFTANPASIYQGQSSTLSWTVTPAGAGTTTISLDQGLGTQNGTWINVSPTATRTYTLTASSLYGTATRSVTVAVSAPPPPPSISSFTTNATSLVVGQGALLSWSVIGADSLLLNGVTVTGTSASVSPTGSTTYTLVARNAFGQDQRSLSITVSNPEPPLAWVSDAVYGWGQLILEKRGSQAIYQQGDHLGTPGVLTNAAGTVIGRQKSLPFGERMSGSGEKSLRRFTNHEDGAQLPVYMQARMYLPTYGRFAQVDPAYDHSDDGLNLYSYVSNQPITRSDPDGMRDVGGGGGKGYMPPLQKEMLFEGQGQFLIWDSVEAYQTSDGRWYYTDWGYTFRHGSPEVTAAQTNQSSGSGGLPGNLGILLSGIFGAVGGDQDRTATVLLVSRELDVSDMSGAQKAIGYMEHAGWVIQTKNGDYIIQSGPNKSGQNEANKVERLEPGKGLWAFSQVINSKGETRTFTVNIQFSYKMPSEGMTKGNLQGIANVWNSKNIHYDYKGPNSNTFAHWFGRQIGLNPVPFSPFHPLPGWGL
ncbi:MAG: RHS repeat-associated core domain-containing protein [Geothrix sp.]|nr:RHS repeat-associated core domain-containing protein [Geothrix sp.]